jgi:diaminohydroxyphosphoribosylaminopyrimidine deaminase / 5-amino-6-(5-phosphoribosylamino)uracil reductase
MKRCFDIARLGAGAVSPNPQVGAVLVNENRIIGEGYHRAYGQAHAEVNALASVAPADRHLIPHSILYVSLQPCSIFGKTPPCTDLIIAHGIKKVIISSLDHTPEVMANGVRILREHGIEVELGLLQTAGEQLAAPRNHAIKANRPYLVLKAALSSEGNFAPADRSSHWLTSEFSKRLTHRWRAESDAIIIGTNTALQDNPALDNRYYFGKSPQKVVLDRSGKLPPGLRLFQGEVPCWVVCEHKPVQAYPPAVRFIEFNWDEEDFLLKLLARLYAEKIGILLLEGGGGLWDLFLKANLWDEARVLHSPTPLPDGIPGPIFSQKPERVLKIGPDMLKVYLKAPNG